jgi:Mg2+-importing ATPase
LRFVNQSVLTGESYPVEKRAVPINHGDDLQAATNALFMGSSVVSGSATLCVVQTGSATAMGAIAERITADDSVSPFDQGTRQFNAMILRLTIGMVLFVLLQSLSIIRMQWWMMSQRWCWPGLRRFLIHQERAQSRP